MINEQDTCISLGDVNRLLDNIIQVDDTHENCVFDLENMDRVLNRLVNGDILDDGILENNILEKEKEIEKEKEKEKERVSLF